MKMYLTVILICVFSIVAFGQEKHSAIDSPLKIISQPQPKRKGDDCAQGVVRLLVTFLPNEQIGKIKLVTGMLPGHNKSAIEAAKQIKFIPALKNGKPTKVSRIVEFRFTIY